MTTDEDIPMFDLGDLVRVSVVFTNDDDEEIDPTTVKLSVRDPSGNTDTYTYGVSTIVRDSLGNFYAMIDADEAGSWYYRWFSTGTGQAADEGYFEVAHSETVNE